MKRKDTIGCVHIACKAVLGGADLGSVQEKHTLFNNGAAAASDGQVHERTGLDKRQSRHARHVNVDLHST